MTLSTTLLAYSQEREILDSALSADKGIRVIKEDDNAAKHLKQRCNKLRVLDREMNQEIYQPGHDLHGRSPYDILTISTYKNTVTMRKRSPELPTIEEL